MGTIGTDGGYVLLVCAPACRRLAHWNDGSSLLPRGLGPLFEETR